MRSNILTLLSAEAIGHHYATGHWGDETIYALAQARARSAGDHFAIRDSHRRLTYAELLAGADALGDDLVRHGLRRGQRVMLWLPDRIDSAMALLACSRHGFVFCPSPHRNHTVAEVLSLMERTRAAALLYQPGFGADAARRDIAADIGDFGWLRRVLQLEVGAAPLAAIDDTPPPAGEAFVNRDPNGVVYLAFTSGSTGLPKGVMHSDNTLLATARAIVAAWHLGDRSVIYSLSPFSHNLGLGTLICSLVAGAEFVIHDRRRGDGLIARLAETGTTYLVGVPTHAIDLLEEIRRHGAAGLERIMGFRISGAAVPGPVVAELLKAGVLVQSGYGMTETCAHQYTMPDDDPRLIIGTSGRSCPGYELRAFDPDDHDVALAPGEIGEIGGRGASLMLGYFDDQASSESCFNADGWFMTGDLGSVDANGYLRITGRKKEVIIRGGHNINPARIEDLVMRHQAVERAAAIPVADPRLGERICLAVMFRAGRKASSEQLLDHLDAAGLTRYEMPEFLVELPDIPLMANGKIQKLELMRGVREGRIQPTPVSRSTGA